MLEATFNNEPCFVTKANYGNKSIALTAVTQEIGEPYDTLTVNLEAYGIVPAEGNAIVLKRYVAPLREAGIIGETIRGFAYGHYTDKNAYECEVLV